MDGKKDGRGHGRAPVDPAMTALVLLFVSGVWA